MPYTRDQLEYLNAASFPTNNAGQIDANRLKTYNNAIIDALANLDDPNTFYDNQTIDASLTVQYTGSFGYLIAGNITTTDDFSAFTASYYADSASFNTRINVNSSSAASKTQFDAFVASTTATSASVSNRLVSLENGEYIITSSIFGAYTSSTNAFTASITASVAALLAASSSYVTKTTFGNFTQSYNAYTQSTNGWLADLTAKTASYATQTQLNTKLDTSVYNANNVQINAFTASTKTRLDNLEAFSASAPANFVSQSLFNAYTSSLQASTASLNAFSASTNLFTASIKATTASLNLFSASILSYTQSINNKTGSFATTGSNSWSGSQVISGSLTVTGSVFMSGPIFEGFTQVTFFSGALSLTQVPLKIGNWSTSSYNGLTVDYLDVSVSQSAAFGTSSIKNVAQVVFGPAGGWDIVNAPLDMWVATGISPLTASANLYAVPNLYVNDQYQRIFGAGYNVGSGFPTAATPRGPVFSGSYNAGQFELYAYYPWNALQSNFKAKITAF